MKKIFTLTLLILLFVLVLVPSVSYAEIIDDDDDEGIVEDKIEIGDFQYKILSEEESIVEIYSKHVFIGGNGEPIRIEGTAKPSIEILENPIVINGKEYTITSIGEGTFYDYEEISDMVIPDTITTIGAYAFWACENLKSVTIPESVVEIGLNAFEKTADLVINTYTGSVAETFAKENDIRVVLLDEEVKDEDDETNDEEIENNQTVGNINIDNPNISLEGKELDKNSSIYEEMTKELKDSGYTKIYCAYELVAHGEIPKEGIELTFEVGIENNGKEVMVLHKKSNGEYETFKATVENGQVKIKVTEFSPFMLAIKEKDTNSTTTPTPENKPSTKPDKVDRPIDNEPPTGIEDYTVVVGMIAIISLAGIFYMKSEK